MSNNGEGFILGLGCLGALFSAALSLLFWFAVFMVIADFFDWGVAITDKI